MASKYIEIKVGLLVIAGAAILVFAIWLAKGYRYGQEFYTVSVIFPEVGTLAAGDPVTVSGVSKGKVKSINLHEGGVLAMLDLTKDVQLKKDASFVVKNIGLMGERFVAIKTGVSESPFDVSQPTGGRFDAGIPEVMGMMGDVIANLNGLVDALEQTIISPQTLDRFSQTITNLQDLTTSLESTSRRNIPKMDSAIANFTHLSKTIRDGFARNQPRVDAAVNNFDSASTRLLSLMDDLALASTSLKTFAVDLEQSEGSLRMFMEDRRLYDDLRTTAKGLDSLVADIRANPKRYINFTVEIF